MNRPPVDVSQPTTTLSQVELAQSVIVRCHTCWCLIRLDDADAHDRWHKTLKHSIVVSSFGVGGIGL